MQEQAAGRFALKQVLDSYVVEIFGEVDFSNVEYFAVMLADCLERPIKGAVIVSLTRASYFDSQLIHALMSAIERYRVRKKPLLVVAPAHGCGRKVIQIVGLDRLVPVFDSLAAALESVRARKARDRKASIYLHPQA